MNIPKLDCIDHFHLYVANKQIAAEWYKRVLGFKTVKSLMFWNDENGPLTIEDPAGVIHLALFTREDQAPSTSIAFKATGEAFLRWRTHLESHELELRIADHKITWSMYFNDPDNNMHEITTYEHEFVKMKLNAV